MSPLLADRANGRGSPVTVGAFVAGNGKNQDRAVATLNPALSHDPDSWTAYAVLCDGVGGIGDGALAANTALTTFRDALEEWLNAEENARAVLSRDLMALSESLRNGLETAHAATRRLSKDPVLRGSATTLDGAVLVPDRSGGLHAVVLHVGDGMVWSLDARGLRRRVEPVAADSGSAVLGAGTNVRASIQRLSLRPGARLVLTSDGFETGLRRSTSPSSDAVTTASLVATTLLKDGASSAEIAHCLGGLAAAHSPDDVSVVVVG